MGLSTKIGERSALLAGNDGESDYDCSYCRAVNTLTGRPGFLRSSL
jgi:hypothetical protein